MVRIACADGRVVTVEHQSLVRSDLRGLNLHRAVLEGADLTGLCGEGVEFRNAVLSLAKLDGGRLDRARLMGARLERASLRGASLIGAMMNGVQAHGVDLEGADLTGVNLHGAQLQGANVVGADLTGAVMDGAHVEGALFDSATLWPSGFAPLDAGAVLFGEEQSTYYRTMPTPELFSGE